MSYNTGSTPPGHYPGVVRVRLGENAGFFFADPGSADLTILRSLPVITWPAPAAVLYGTPLGGPQLNAVADVPGQILASRRRPALFSTLAEDPGITTTFVPADLQRYEEVSATNTPA